MIKMCGWKEILRNSECHLSNTACEWAKTGALTCLGRSSWEALDVESSVKTAIKTIQVERVSTTYATGQEQYHSRCVTQTLGLVYSTRR
jgi:hypothetical protein